MNTKILPYNLGILLAITAVGGSVAHATLLSHESFTGYTIDQQIQITSPSPIVSGYTGNWTGIDFGTARPVVSAGSLTYSDPLYLGSSGDKVTVPVNPGGAEIESGDSGRVYRVLDSTLAVTDTTASTLYLSFLFQSGQQSGATTYQMLSLYNTSTTDANRNFDIGITTNGSLSGTQYNFGVDNAYTDTGVAASTAVRLLVVKFNLSATAGQDSVTVWVDPTLGTGDPTVGGTTVTGKTLTWDRLTLSDYDGNSAAWDEIRWGTTFDSVTAVPEPSAFATIAGLVGLVAVGLRRGSRHGASRR